MKRYLMMLVWAGLASVTVGLQTTVASPARQGAEQPSAKQKTVHMRIVGMTCPACAKGLEASFRNLAGVTTASIDYKAGEAVITFDPAKQSIESLSKLVKSSGYQVKETKVV